MTYVRLKEVVDFTPAYNKIDDETAVSILVYDVSFDFKEEGDEEITPPYESYTLKAHGYDDLVYDEAVAFLKGRVKDYEIIDIVFVGLWGYGDMRKVRGKALVIVEHPNWVSLSFDRHLESSGTLSGGEADRWQSLS